MTRSQFAVALGVLVVASLAGGDNEDGRWATMAELEFRRHGRAAYLRGRTPQP